MVHPYDNLVCFRFHEIWCREAVSRSGLPLSLFKIVSFGCNLTPNGKISCVFYSLMDWKVWLAIGFHLSMLVYTSEPWTVLRRFLLPSCVNFAYHSFDADSWHSQQAWRESTSKHSFAQNLRERGSHQNHDQCFWQLKCVFSYFFQMGNACSMQESSGFEASEYSCGGRIWSGDVRAKCASRQRVSISFGSAIGYPQ